MCVCLVDLCILGRMTLRVTVHARKILSVAHALLAGSGSRDRYPTAFRVMMSYPPREVILFGTPVLNHISHLAFLACGSLSD